MFRLNRRCRTAGTAIFAAILLSFLSSPPLCGQQATDNLSAAELVHAFVKNNGPGAASEQQNYTYIVLHQDLTYDNGRLVDKRLTKSEAIHIDGLPYLRRLEIDGKPLTGKDLKQEQQLYDNALKKRSGLSEEERNRQQKLDERFADPIPMGHLETDFTPVITGNEDADGKHDVTLDLKPANPKAKSPLQRHIMLVLDRSNLKLLEYRVDYLAADHDFCKGTLFEGRNLYLDGVLLPAWARISLPLETNMGSCQSSLYGVGTTVYSNYQRFRVSATIRDAPAPETDSPSPPEK